jgi:hypothetical protein
MGKEFIGFKKSALSDTGCSLQTKTKFGFGLEAFFDRLENP